MLSTATIVNGSIIKTSRGWLYFSIALGKVTVEDITVIALSPQLPLGKKILRLTVSDIAEFNSIPFVIESIA